MIFITILLRLMAYPLALTIFIFVVSIPLCFCQRVCPRGCVTEGGCVKGVCDRNICYVVALIACTRSTFGNGYILSSFFSFILTSNKICNIFIV